MGRGEETWPSDGEREEREKRERRERDGEAAVLPADVAVRPRDGLRKDGGGGRIRDLHGKAGQARVHQKGFQHPGDSALCDLWLRHRVLLECEPQDLPHDEQLALLHCLPWHDWFHDWP